MASQPGQARSSLHMRVVFPTSETKPLTATILGRFITRVDSCWCCRFTASTVTVPGRLAFLGYPEATTHVSREFVRVEKIDQPYRDHPAHLPPAPRHASL